MLSAVFFMNQKGEVIISRIYRDDIPKGMANAFRLEVLGSRDTNRSPIKTISSTSFLYIFIGGIYIVGVARANVDASMAYGVLYRLVDIFRIYFDGKFDEAAIHNNFVLAYEVLDEVLDFGYPQNCSKDILKMYITQGRASLKDEDDVKQLKKIQKMTDQVTGITPWRTPGLKYAKNEIYIDVIESLNLLMSGDGNVLRADVAGQVMMKTMLSGMPECKFGINDKIVLAKEPKQGVHTAKKGSGIVIDDVAFHQCVRLGKFDSDRTISFIPPDGEFELMRYRTTDQVNLPFKVLPMVKEIGRSRVEASVTVKSCYDAKLFGLSVVVKIPMPKNTATCKVVCTNGRAKYIPDQEAIVWRIKRFPGDMEYTIRAEVGLISTSSIEQKKWSRPPISLEFQVPMFAASSFQVRFLKVVEKSNYNSVKWVRYLTKAGNYTVRI